jgi:DNA-binding transcriptional MerR regulator
LTFEPARSRTVSGVGTYTIGGAAARSGFPASTLRYYEALGIVAPVERTGAGYRVYDERSLGRLAFIARAKQLGCTLDEISALVQAWDGQRCEPVQTQLRALVAAKRDEARRRIDELVALIAQLQEATAALSANTPDGPCDETCGCSRPPSPSPGVPADPPIACTLEVGDVAQRLADWRSALASVVARTPIAGGLRLSFAPGVALASLADLIAAEQACCAFLRFALTVDDRGPALEVTAPADGAAAVAALFGGPAGTSRAASPMRAEERDMPETAG